MGLTVRYQQRKHLVIYCMILTSIALISFSIYALLERALTTQKEAAYVINVSGRQRMLSQRIIVKALEHQQYASPASATALNESIVEMHSSHQFLINTAPIPETIRAMYFEKPEVDNAIYQYLTLANAVLKDNNDKPSLNKLLSMHTNLLNDLDNIVFEYQKNAQEKTQTQHHLQLALLLLIYLLLVITAFLVVLPIHKKLERYFQLSIKDALTGLYNRRYFLQNLEEEHSRCSRYNTTYSLCIIDIDHFKSVNDQYGHPIGDEILREVADNIISEVRTSDQCFRIGGEEFAILLIGTNEQDAVLAIEKLRKKIEHARHPYKDTYITTTISTGIATCYSSTKNTTGSTLTTEDIIKRADMALYMAKESGRNNIYLWSRKLIDKTCMTAQ
jgi:diguanylate cyclase (GGDEF)-like protein